MAQSETASESAERINAELRAASDGKVSLEYLGRVCTGDYFLPDEAEVLLAHFYGSMTSALADEAAELWQLTDDDALLVDAKQLETPDDFTNALNPQYVQARRGRAWFGNALRGMHELANMYGIDARPLLRFTRFLYGETLTDSDKADLKDCVSLLTMAIEKAGRQPAGGADLLTLDDITRLVNAERQTVYNKLCESRKAGNAPSAAIEAKGSRPAKYSYATIRPWLLQTWPESAGQLFASFADVKALLT